jgi:hypothetical protein
MYRERLQIAIQRMIRSGIVTVRGMSSGEAINSSSSSTEEKHEAIFSSGVT